MPQIGEVSSIVYGYAHRKKRHFIWVACEDCGKERWVSLSKWNKGTSRLCQPCVSSRIMKRVHYIGRGSTSKSWKGGRKQRRDYVSVLISHDNFFFPMVSDKSSQGDGYVLEHRLVMAKALGRCLQPWELVHHKNGVKDDNRLENLQLTMRGAHRTDYASAYRKGFADGLAYVKQTQRLGE